MSDDGTQGNAQGGLPSGWTPQMLQFRAEQASLGGVCAITVGNLVVLAKELESDPQSRSREIKEIFREGHMLSVRQSNKPSWWRKRKTEVPSFYPLSDPIVLPQSKADVEFGIYKNTVGLLICGEKFVPLIRLVEFTRPGIQIPDDQVTPQCSYAELNVQVLDMSGDEIVITSEDEEKGLIAILSEDLTYHITHDVLRAVQDCFAVDHDLSLDERIAKIDSMFDFEKITYKALGLQPGTEIEKEIQIRRAADFLRKDAVPGQQILLLSRAVENPNDPSCDSVQNTYLTFNADGSFSLCETISFPKLPDPNPQIIALIAFGNEIGNVVYQGDNLIEPSYEEVADYSYNLISFDEDLIKAVSVYDPLDRHNSLTSYKRRQQKDRTLEDMALDAVEAVLEIEKASIGLAILEDGESSLEVTFGKFIKIPADDGKTKYYKCLSKEDLERLALSLTGTDSERAEKLRSTILGLSKTYGNEREAKDIEFAVIKSYAGVDSEAAWEARKRHIRKYGNWTIRNIGVSLVGLSSEKVDQMVGSLQDQYNSVYTLLHLTGREDEKAWEIRERHLDRTRNNFSAVMSSLSGIDSPRAEKMRERIIKSWSFYSRKSIQHDSEFSLACAQGFIGDSSFSGSRQRKEFWLPKELIAHTGSDSRKAWKVRERALAENRHLEEVALSLAGLTSERAEQMRKDIESALLSDENKNLINRHRSYVGSVIASSYMGDIHGLVKRIGGMIEVTTPEFADLAADQGLGLS